MSLTRIKTNNILDRQVFSNDLADSVVTFEKLQITGTANAGDVLKVDGFGNLLFEPASGTSTNLNALTDVDIVTPQNFDSLVYNSTTGNWEASSKTSSSVSLASLSDTTFVHPVQQNQYLGFDGFTWRHRFISADQIVGLDDVAVSGLLNDLDDVNVTGATANQRLTFDGAVWFAQDAAELDSIDNFADVDTTTVLPVANDALVWNGGTNQWAPSAISGLGSETFVVADITARDLLSPAEGDQAFVRIGTSGEYELYIWDAAWILIGTADSARTDANTAEAIVLWSTGSPVLIGNVSQDSRVTTVTVEVTVAFNDATSVLTVGDSGDNSRLLSNDMIDLTEVGTYVCNVDYIYTSATDTDVFTYFNFATSTQGAARVIVTHV